MHPTTQSLLSLVIRRSKDPSRILDMGCGDGVIAHKLKDVFPEAEVWATDIKLSGPMSFTAEGLFLASDPERRIKWNNGNLFDGLFGKFDVIVCTLPNQPTAECEGFDPLLCDGGETGFELLARFVDQVEDYLTESGRVFMLIKPGQEKHLDGWGVVENRFAVFQKKL